MGVMGCAAKRLRGSPQVVRRLRRKLRGVRGQMTVELCVALPVAIVVAVIATNALTFFGCCAEFDRTGRNAVRTFAATAAHGQDAGNAAAQVRGALEGALDADNVELDVAVSADYRGFEEYVMTLRFHPTLFGLGLREEVLGVPLPALTHEARMAVSPYKPGMLF